jgi:hypothetical protein
VSEETRESASADDAKARRLANLERAREAKRQKKLAEKSEAAPGAEAATPASLVHTTSAEIRERAERRKAPASIEELAERHRGPPLPPIEEVARQTETYMLGENEVPPAELDPHLADGITVGHVPEQEDFVPGDRPPRQFEDIFAHYQLDGSGEYEVTVDRKTPRIYDGVACAGMQRPILHAMDRATFARIYGGGDYVCVVYGPAKRGRLIDPMTGKPKRKALTGPIPVAIALGIYPPNINAGVLDDEDPEEYEEDEETEHPMQGYRPAFTRLGGNGRLSTKADAQMYEASLTHEERREAREDERRKEIRRELSESQGQLPDMLRLMTEVQTKAAEKERNHILALNEQHRQELKQAEEERRRSEEKAAQKPTEATALSNALSSAMKVLGEGKSDTGTLQALQQAQGEIQRMVDKHTGEVQRLLDKHANELQRIEKEHERHVERIENLHKDDMRRADDRMKEVKDASERRCDDIEKRAERQIAEIRSSYEKQLADLRTDAASRLAEQHRIAEQQRADDRRNADRDEKLMRETFETRLGSLKDMYENRVSAMGQEITRERTETDRYRQESEKNKDVVGKINEIKQTAEALGMRPDTGGGEEYPQDWKGMLSMLGRDLIQKAPDLINSAADSVRSLRQPGQYAAMQPQGSAPGYQPHYQPQPVQNSQGQWVPQEEPLAFGTEDGPEFYSPSDLQSSNPPRQPRAQPEIPGQVYAPMQVPQPQQPMAAPPAPAPMAPQPMAAYQQPQQQVPQPAVRAAQPQQPALAAEPISDEQILHFAPVLTQAYEENADPLDFAADFIEQAGPAMARTVASSLTPARVGAVLAKQPGGVSHPLARREGQRFLKLIMDAVLKATAPGAQ